MSGGWKRQTDVQLGIKVGVKYLEQWLTQETVMTDRLEKAAFVLQLSRG